MIFTPYTSDLPISVVAQREYIAAKAAGVGFATRDQNTWFIYCFPARLTEPTLRDKSGQPNARAFVFIVRAGIGYTPVRIIPCDEPFDWMTVADAAIAEEEK